MPPPVPSAPWYHSLGSRGRLDTSHIHSLPTTTPNSESSARKADAPQWGFVPRGERLDPQDQVTERVDTDMDTRSCAHATLAPNGEQQDPAETLPPPGTAGHQEHRQDLSPRQHLCGTHQNTFSPLNFFPDLKSAQKHAKASLRDGMYALTQEGPLAKRNVERDHAGSPAGAMSPVL